MVNTSSLARNAVMCDRLTDLSQVRSADFSPQKRADFSPHYERRTVFVINRPDAISYRDRATRHFSYS